MVGYTLAIVLTVLLFRVLGRTANGRQTLADVELVVLAVLATVAILWVRAAKRVARGAPPPTVPTKTRRSSERDREPRSRTRPGRLRGAACRRRQYPTILADGRVVEAEDREEDALVLGLDGAEGAADLDGLARVRQAALVLAQRHLHLSADAHGHAEATGHVVRDDA